MQNVIQNIKAAIDGLTKVAKTRLTARVKQCLENAESYAKAHLKEEAPGLAAAAKPPASGTPASAGSTKAGAAAKTALAVIGLGLLSLLWPQVHAADSQGYPTTFTGPTNMPGYITATNPTPASQTMDYVPLRQGKGVAAQWQFKASATLSNASGSANPITMYIAPSVDGTNPVTASAWSWTPPLLLLGTGTQLAATNWSRGSLDGYMALFVTGISNSGTNGSLTNLMLLFNVPNN
jgi:hypothetical protein